MVRRTFQQIGELFKRRSRDTWQRLEYVKESARTRGILGPVRFSEETITDLMMMDLYLEGSTVALFEQTTKQKESISGTDFELWVGSIQDGWFRFALQAKRIYLNTDGYHTANYKNKNGQRQIELLRRYAYATKAAPLYCLYNYSDAADPAIHWHCCNEPPDVNELGCTVTPLSNVWNALDKKVAKFRYIHQTNSTLPLRCLVACPKVQDALKAMSQGEVPETVSGISSLFDPRACYHRRLPLELLPGNEQRNRVVSENRSGGVILSVRSDRPRGSQDTGHMNVPDTGILEDPYPRDNGEPLSAGVVEVQPLS